MKKGFTLLEILLVIAAIGILAAIVIVAINPNRQLAQVRDSQRYSDTNTLSKAYDQYLIDNASYPSGLTNQYQEVCAENASDCTGYIDISSTLTPQYIASIPTDPSSTGNGSGYEVAINPDNNKISIRAINPEIASTIVINEVIEIFEGARFVWGSNTNGDLGLGYTSSREESPVQGDTDNDWSEIVSASHTIGRKIDGTIYSWGWNIYGQLGQNDTSSRNTPTQIGTDTDWTMVSVGYDSSFAMKDDGTIWAWGRNNYGQLGQGDTTNRNIPTQVGTDTDWIFINSSGQDYTFAIKDDGTLWGWGNNTEAQLGLGDTTSRDVPTQIGTDANWTYASAGRGHGVGMKSDNSIWAWGRNFQGQIGDGTNTQRTTPVQIGTDTDWEILNSGAFHTVAMKTDGTLWTWGLNNLGQLGQGDTINRNTPTQVGTDTDWNTLSSGYSTVHTIKNDGTLWGWGANNYGNIGDGTTVQRNAPVQVGTDAIWTRIPENFGLSSGGFQTP